ncbi:MAG: hypothetical protein ACTSX8_04560 [Alphaproteobacteria bacterium]
MVKLTDVRELFVDALIVHSNEDTRLTELGTGEPCDDSFKCVYVAVPRPSYSCKMDEMLFIRINGAVAFSWPLEQLMLSYEHYASGRLPDEPDELAELHRCVSKMTQKLSQRWLSATAAEEHELTRRTEVLARVIKELTQATSEWNRGAGVSLSALIPPRCVFRVETSKGTPLKAYLRGVRARSVR